MVKFLYRKSPSSSKVVSPQAFNKMAARATKILGRGRSIAKANEGNDELVLNKFREKLKWSLSQMLRQNAPHLTNNKFIFWSQRILCKKSKIFLLPKKKDLTMAWSNSFFLLPIRDVGFFFLNGNCYSEQKVVLLYISGFGFGQACVQWEGV